jgi:NADH dehydrogenase (ubiquinone) Fe-S protein 4
MKKAIIYKPSKSAMQSGIKKFDKWIVEFLTDKPGINPLMGWESSTDTYNSLKLEFRTKELAIEYSKKNKINYELIKEKIRKVTKKSYADNFKK